jgi:RNA polymerase sigma-70 factor, ECF subfamily
LCAKQDLGTCDNRAVYTGLNNGCRLYISGEKLQAHLTEADLVNRARAGDTDAWATLILAHQEAVFRLAYLILGHAGDAEDIAQDTFIRAYRYLSSFDDSRALRPWLFSIAANLARNRRRSLGRYLHQLTRMARLDPEPVSDVERDAAQRAEAQALWRAVQRLEAVDQEIIYLRFFLELSVEETAESLNIATGTVKSRLHRALGRLRGVVASDFPALWKEQPADE